jgi:hypothetical protein
MLQRGSAMPGATSYCAALAFGDFSPYIPLTFLTSSRRWGWRRKGPAAKERGFATFFAEV